MPSSESLPRKRLKSEGPGPLWKLGGENEAIQVLESRHGRGFWQKGMELCTDGEFMERLLAWGRTFALKMVDKPWRAHVYKHYKLQVAYIQEYFSARAAVVKAELHELKELAAINEQSDQKLETDKDEHTIPWQRFFGHIKRNKHVRIVDLAGGPGCCAAGACQFFNEWFDETNQCSIHATVLDPVEEWAWCSEKLGFNFKLCSSLSDMLLDDSTFTADVVLVGWAMNFASKLFWKRLHVAFGQRGVLANCNRYALIMVMDRGMDQLRFKDHRQRVLQRPQVIQRDHGMNVTYSFLIGEEEAESTSSDQSPLKLSPSCRLVQAA
ncbi:unnamed protein product [Durusdinium trenchii]|uniref:Methyltransferase domain-containing protein n=2 Tax=Durusdinium trenchii TaxID=1381693 RepID=A0ABP0JRJ1_9DINO